MSEQLSGYPLRGGNVKVSSEGSFEGAKSIYHRFRISE